MIKGVNGEKDDETEIQTDGFEISFDYNTLHIQFITIYCSITRK